MNFSSNFGFFGSFGLFDFWTFFDCALSDTPNAVSQTGGARYFGTPFQNDATPEDNKSTHDSWHSCPELEVNHIKWSLLYDDDWNCHTLTTAVRDPIPLQGNLVARNN